VTRLATGHGYRGRVLRTALKPRWLGLLVVVLVAATGMAWLGQWQLDRARERGAAAGQRAGASVSPLEEVLTARQTFPGDAAGRKVLARGTWDADRQLLVAGREVHGRAAYWVVTPLRLADGSGVAVVRGWVPTAGDPAAELSPAARSGPTAVSGRLEPAEPPAQRAPGEGSGLPAGQLERLAMTDLIARWPYPLLTGYLVLEGQVPEDPRSALGRGPVPAPETGLAWQNLTYAVQWWAFALFGFFFWWRLVRDDHHGRLRGGDPAAGPPAPVGEHGPVAEAPSTQTSGARP
jgi:cytochrome oxidase assembly protein ShyY1